jgi:cytochrome c oxidase subunit 3
MLTGFHGLHVFIGSVMILVCISRVIFNSFSTNHHLGLEFTVWYWHFVDVVWIFLFIFVYIWGSGVSS